MWANCGSRICKQSIQPCRLQQVRARASGTHLKVESLDVRLDAEEGRVIGGRRTIDAVLHHLDGARHLQCGQAAG